MIHHTRYMIHTYMIHDTPWLVNIMEYASRLAPKHYHFLFLFLTRPRVRSATTLSCIAEYAVSMGMGCVCVDLHNKYCQCQGMLYPLVVVVQSYS